MNFIAALQKPVSTAERGRRLIISSGDISDVDGFLALAEYSKVRMLLLNVAIYLLHHIEVLYLSNCVYIETLWIPKTGADVIFVMNYPAYIGEETADESYHIHHPGLGYKYTSDQVDIFMIAALQPA